MIKKILTLVFIGCLFCIPQVFAASSVTLEWQANTEPDLAGYRAFVREGSAGYDLTKPLWEGVETTCNLSDLDETKTYHFAVTAFDKEGYMSGISNEVVLIGGAVPDGMPPKEPKILKATTILEVP